MKPSRIGFSTYLAVPCIPFPSLTRYFCFKVFRFFLIPLTFQHLYYITSFSFCQALFSTFYFFLSNQSSLKSISIDVLDYPICITHHYQEDFSLNQHTYYNSSIPLCQPFFLKIFQKRFNLKIDTSNKPYQESFPRELNCYFDDLLTGKINRPTGHACNP